MKKFFNSILTLAIALAFTACEDVPMPYNTPNSNGNGDEPTAQAKGDGTVDNPYNAVGVTQYIENNLSSGETSTDNVYITGRVASVTECSAAYGNVTFYISDDGTSSNTFEVYRCYGLNNKKIDSDDAVQVGDSVVIYGKVTNYNGTYETVQNGAYIMFSSRLGSSDAPTPAGTPTGSGTQSDPYNVAMAEQIIASGAASESKVYVSGTVSSVEASSFDASYGSLIYYISDDGATSNQLEVYRGYGLGGDKFTSADALKVGDKVVVYGVLVDYNGTHEVSLGSQLYSLNGKTSSGGSTPTEGEAKGSGTASDPFNAVGANKYIEENLGNNEISPKDIYIKGIVASTKDISPTYGNATFYISDDGKNTNTFYVYRCLGLNKAKISSTTDVEVGDEVVVCGKLVNYYNATYGNTYETVQNEAWIYSITKGSTGGGSGFGELSGENITLKMSSLGLDNQADLTSYTLSDGTTLTFKQNGGNNAPKYYTSYTAARMYALNSLVVANTSKKISGIFIQCTDPYQGTNYNGNATMYTTVDGSKAGNIAKTDTSVTLTNLGGNTVEIVNDHTSNSGGTQLRIVSITIYYAE